MEDFPTLYSFMIFTKGWTYVSWASRSWGSSDTGASFLVATSEPADPSNPQGAVVCTNSSLVHVVAAFLIFVYLALARRVVLYIRGLDWRLERVAYGPGRKIGMKGAISSVLQWLVPFGTHSWRRQPYFTIAFFLFHIGVVIVLCSLPVTWSSCRNASASACLRCHVVLDALRCSPSSVRL